jgi:ribosomal protein L4
MTGQKGSYISRVVQGQSAAQVMVGGAVAHPTATPEPDAHIGRKTDPARSGLAKLLPSGA